MSVTGGTVGPMMAGTQVTSSGMVVGGGYSAGGYAAGGGVDGGCEAGCVESGMGRMCFEPDPTSMTKSHQWKYVGAGQGSYDSVQQVAWVGQGQGSFDRAEVTTHSGYRCRTCCVTMFTCVLFIIFCVAVIPWIVPKLQQDAPPMDIPYEQDCTQGAAHWKTFWDAAKQNYCCQYHNIGCPEAVATPVKVVRRTHDVMKVHRVPHPVTHYVQVEVPHVHYHKIIQEEHPYDCEEGVEDWKHLWHTKHQRYCCFLRKVACPVKVVKHTKTIYITKTKLVPQYIHMKETENKTVVVPKYYAKEVEPKPIIVHVEQPPKIVYQTVNQTRYIRVPVPGKPRIVVQEEPVEVKMPPEVVKVYDHIKVHPFEVRNKTIVETVVHHEHHFDCHAGFSNWYFGWSPRKKNWCCDHENMACPGTWHGHGHLHVHASASLGHATGKIYDCKAGFSNWLHGWSDSKKTWCCDKYHVGCAPHSCEGDEGLWSVGKREWCCGNFQKGCAKTTLSPMKCDAACTHSGETATCKDRISWAEKHVFQSRENACALSYSQVQVECSVCRGCSIQDAGCSVNVATSAAFDCNAALNNFFRAWSPSKKQWCCTQKGKGCEGPSPPHVDPGFGMVWKHVQVSGYWTWVAVHGSGSVPQSLPYDCHAGLQNFQIGWSSGKRAWCCSKQHLGCGNVGGAAAGGGSYVHHTTVVMDGAAVGHPPSIAAHGMVWHYGHSTGGGGWHWVQVPADGHLPYDCDAGFSRWKTGWSSPKKTWCCKHIGKACE